MSKDPYVVFHQSVVRESIYHFVVYLNRNHYLEISCNFTTTKNTFNLRRKWDLTLVTEAR